MNKPSHIAVIVAAGSGSRAGGSVPKQFAPVNGKPMLWHSVRAFQQHGEFARIIIVLGHGHQALADSALAGLEPVEYVTGAATRQQSVRNALEHVAATGGGEFVFIHDAARPGLTGAVIARLNAALDSAPGAVPALPVVDSLSCGISDVLGPAVERDGLYRVQTPQAFRFAAILGAHRNWFGDGVASDDARILQAAGLEVALVEGDERLRKVTFAEDLDNMTTKQVRTGIGYDVHRLGAGHDLWLCGLKIPHDKGLIGHSDADVALHAITDALLGAIAEGDIGDHFPPSDPRWKGANSAQFLAHATQLAADKGAVLQNVDLTIICEAPKIGPHRRAMRERIAEILNIAPDQISVKATTTEGTGPTGRGEAIAAQAIFTVSI